MFSPWYEPEFVWNLTNHKKRIEEVKQFINETTDAVSWHW